MHARKCVILGLLFCGTLITLAGCPMIGSDRLNNQGGGSLVSAALKIAQGKLSSLTPDEIQFISDFVMRQAQTQGLLPADFEALTDADADAVATFIDDNDVDTIADAQALINDPQNVVISDEVRAALEHFLSVNLDDIQLTNFLP